MTEKLAKYMAHCGVASRRRCEEFIRSGWVTVDGAVVSTPESRVDPLTVRVEVRGKIIKPLQSFRYILLNKPIGYLCTCRPGREKGKTLLDLIKAPERLYPAGRLDRDTSGLVLLTNDGDLVQKLIHPSFEQEREYRIEVTRDIVHEDLDNLKQGIILEDGLSRFKKIELTGSKTLTVILGEGRKRQIRRTLKALDLPIQKLKRVRFGPLKLGAIPEGRWRNLTPNEIKTLKT